VRGNRTLVLALGLAGLLVAAGLTVWGAARRRAPRRRPAPDPRVDMSFVDSAPGELVGAGRTAQSPQGRP
jgi:ABC-type transporter Mla subunit MlaD